MFIFAVLLIIAEFQWRPVLQYFHFLYYSWGKAVLDFFLFTMCFDTSRIAVFQVPVAWFFFATGVMYLIIAFACKRNPAAEAEKKKKQEEAKQKKAEQKKPAENKA